jgi:hypothetical protein
LVLSQKLQQNLLLLRWQPLLMWLELAQPTWSPEM